MVALIITKRGGKQRDPPHSHYGDTTQGATTE